MEIQSNSRWFWLSKRQKLGCNAIITMWPVSSSTNSSQREMRRSKKKNEKKKQQQNLAARVYRCRKPAASLPMWTRRVAVVSCNSFKPQKVRMAFDKSIYCRARAIHIATQCTQYALMELFRRRSLNSMQLKSLPKLCMKIWFTLFRLDVKPRGVRVVRRFVPHHVKCIEWNAINKSIWSWSETIARTWRPHPITAPHIASHRLCHAFNRNLSDGKFCFGLEAKCSRGGRETVMLPAWISWIYKL